MASVAVAMASLALAKHLPLQLLIVVFVIRGGKLPERWTGKLVRTKCPQLRETIFGFFGGVGSSKWRFLFW
eukprot:1032054-Ditylum_brightwellii.AAC.1